MHLCYHPHFDWLRAHGYQWGINRILKSENPANLYPPPLKLSENFRKHPCLKKNDEKVLFDFIHLWESFFNNILWYNDRRRFRLIEKSKH